ncbi:hypothetical protein DXG01_006206, partial [Tephrocybe rancida]
MSEAYIFTNAGYDGNKVLDLSRTNNKTGVSTAIISAKTLDVNAQLEFQNILLSGFALNLPETERF